MSRRVKKSTGCATAQLLIFRVRTQNFTTLPSQAASNYKDAVSKSAETESSNEERATTYGE
jgi:hypothetical protein